MDNLYKETKLISINKEASVTVESWDGDIVLSLSPIRKLQLIYKLLFRKEIKFINTNKKLDIVVRD